MPVHTPHLPYTPSLSADNPVEPLLVPSNGVVHLDFVLEPNLSLRPLALGDAHTRAAHHDEEVHTENTDSGVVLDTEINVFFDTEAEVTGGREVAAMSAILMDSAVELCVPLAAAH